MKLKMNGKESKVRYLVGSGPKGSLIGQIKYLISSDECPQDVQTHDGYTYIDDLALLATLALSNVDNLDHHIRMQDPTKTR